MSCTEPKLHRWGMSGAAEISAYTGIPPIDKHYTILPCGKCIGCKLLHAQGWKIRCQHEASLHAANSFITLTYAPEHLPDYGTLEIKHWQLFAKMLRKHCGKFRFFMCGEYGSKNYTERPHYHSLIFGLDFSEDRIQRGTRNGFALYTSPTLAKCWPHGHHEIGTLTSESASYTAQYTLKKQIENADLLHYPSRPDLHTGELKPVPPFVNMSRNPGLAHEWFSRYRDDVYPSDNVHLDGREYRPPKYYDRLLKSTCPKRHDAVKIARRVHNEKRPPLSTFELSTRKYIQWQRESKKRPRNLNGPDPGPGG